MKLVVTRAAATSAILGVAGSVAFVMSAWVLFAFSVVGLIVILWACVKLDESTQMLTDTVDMVIDQMVEA